MIVNYALSLEEYVASQKAYRIRMASGRVFFRNLYGLACVAAVLGISFWFSGFRWLGATLFLIAGLLLLERTILWKMRTAAAYRSTPRLGEQIALKIDENNIVHTSGAESRIIRWANILACHETKNLFLLRPGTDELLVVPKRAFSPGDLSGFKELRQKELIVKTTRENPDAFLLRFVVSWGVLAIAFVALFIGNIHNFLTALPKGPQRSASFPTVTRTGTESVPASASELRGRGTVYLVPLGKIQSISLPQLLEDFRKRYGLEMHLLPEISPPYWAKSTVRKQFVAEDLVTAMKSSYPTEAAEPDAVMVGITNEDMYISQLNWTYAFSFRSEERFAVISNFHLSEPDEDGNKPVAPEVVQRRASEVLARDVGILHYRLQPSNNYNSVLYKNIDESSELDNIGQDYLESDVMVRADLHVEGGDPCFILRHYTAAERKHTELGELTGCSGSYEELNLETIQLDLRYGLLMDQRTDFLVPDRIPLKLTRVIRTQDDRSRAFGVGGNHNLNIFLVGDRWPFTWMDLVLEHGGRSHFRRTNWGFGYWDARYANRDLGDSMFAGSTISWAWPGWKLKSGGHTYEFPDPNGASRPEQGALIGIQNYDGKRLDLPRDADGNLLRARSPAGHELDFKYDQNHRVIEVRQRDGGQFEYFYDARGHLAKVEDADHHITEYGYDESGRMNRIAQDGADICTLEYDSAGRVKSETVASGRTYVFHYTVANGNTISRVEISDSAGPVRRVRISPVEYSLEVLNKSP
jgi:YD repeat-containing protein